MIAPAPSPGPVKRPGRMLVFYVSTGVVLALFVSGWFAWTPLRVWYWEREVRRHMPMMGLVPGAKNPHARAVHCLVAIGPQSRAAVERLFKENDSALQIYLLVALRDRTNTWALSLLVGQVRTKDCLGNFELFDTVSLISDRDFMKGSERQTSGPAGIGLSEVDFAEVRRRILVWWEREGKVNYGRGKCPGGTVERGK
jgi:hypothetical protein